MQERPTVLPGLGTIVTESMADRRSHMISANFTALPVAERYGDHYLQQLAIFVAGKEDLVLTTALLPGHKEYLADIGITKDVLEMPYTQVSDDPYDADALTSLRRCLPSRSILVDRDTGTKFRLAPTFITAFVHEQAGAVGLEVVNLPHSTITNDKVHLREHASAYGITLFPGAVMTGAITEDSLRDVAGRWENTTYGVWLKLGQGSGGDAVFYLAHVSEDSMRTKISEIRKEYIQQHPGSWDQTEWAPVVDKVIIELDARNLDERGKILLGSNLVIQGACVGTFEQITENGAFVGSKTVSLSEQEQSLLNEQTSACQEYMNSIGFKNHPFGIDYIFYHEKETGKLKIGILEINARLPISAYAHWTANQLGHREFLNTNITFPRPVAHFAEVRGLLQVDEDENLLYDSNRGWGVVPAAFRTIPTAASPHAKVFIIGNQEQQEYVQSKLQGRNIQLGVHAL